ncbi:putative tannase [Aspergillus vadensis CBS 113365]|uniref:Carboxylic ester hydrolase n=1 Tax=Aspergillus vadensis (strain CBS 113365 / IMI 142717 / IBT 24658) TaxID=1448311 RepID=A0A319BPG6_ASPVC|nr:tannase and feruloyl esterase family protein [Aspergillus vadensis CBS 113365]PYH73629.1 tannase and feruloyl esterase family protein [Aspergillus vadensis CBS 113365]
MRSSAWASIATTALAALANAATPSTLAELCTDSIVKAALPPSEFIQGITIDSDSVTTEVVTNSSFSSDFYPSATIDYCNVTFAYSHDGIDGDQVLLEIWLPAPTDFKNRWLSTGGGGYAINSGDQSLPGGVMYGAASGMTDGGFGGFSNNADTAMLLANGTLNYETLYMFAYKAHRELSLLGKALTRNVYGMSDSDKLYAYYQGCSEGGREGWSQVQRFGDEWDGAIIGAPAFRWSFQQTQHLYSNIVEKTLDYYPPPCELDKIVNETIAACDAMDGKVDWVVARTDLCLLDFDISTIEGKPYSCAASRGTPAQNGTVSAKGIEVAKTIINGLHDSQGRRVYFSYQPTAAFDDAETQYNSTTGQWGLDIDQLGGEYIALLVDKNGTTLDSLDGITYDTLKDWMISGLQEYYSTLQTTWPDLTPFHNAGGKVIHFHGDADFSIPTAASIRYWESVRSIMYPNQDYNSSAEALNEWYRLYTVPGAGHCATNDAMPNGPFPQTNMAVMIDWVENGVVPTTLNATVLQGENEGQNQQLCAWPLRPLWTNNGTTMECVYNQRSIDSWHYDLDAVPMPVY